MTTDSTLLEAAVALDLDSLHMRQLASQRSFEAMFDHKPEIDTRTPRDIKNGVSRI